MPTTVVKTIGSGGDYSTVDLWEAAAPANLVTSDQIWEGQLISAATVISQATPSTIGGSTTDATRFKRLTTAAGASFANNVNVQTTPLRGNTSAGAAIVCTATYQYTLENTENYFQMSNLQIIGGGADHSPAFKSFSCSGITIDRCIFEGTGGGSAFTRIIFLEGAGGDPGFLRNSLIIQRASGQDMIARIADTIKVYNCTFAVPADKAKVTNAIDAGYTTAVIFKNCVFVGATNLFSAAVAGVSNCYADDATPPAGVTTCTFNSSLFVGINDATRDFRLVSGSVLIDAGATDVANAATDIVGTARPSGAAYDVGAWEFVATGPGVFPHPRIYANGAIQANLFIQSALPAGIAARVFGNNAIQITNLVTDGAGRVVLRANGQLICNSTIIV